MSGKSPWPSPMARLVEAALALAAAESEQQYRASHERLRRAAVEFRDSPRGAAGPARGTIYRSAARQQSTADAAPLSSGQSRAQGGGAASREGEGG